LRDQDEDNQLKQGNLPLNKLGVTRSDFPETFYPPDPALEIVHNRKETKFHKKHSLLL